MRLLHVSASLDPRQGGVSEAVRQMCASLGALGHPCEAASCDGSEWEPSADWPAATPVHRLGPPQGSFRRAPRLGSWLEENARRFDAVIVHGLWQYPGLTVRRSVHPRVPYFVFPHGMLDPWFKRTYPLKHLKKWLYWPWAEYRVLGTACAVLFTCEEERRLARESFWLYSARERVAPLGLADPGDDPATTERQRAAFLARFPALRDRRIVLFLGRLHVKKGCDLLLDAFAAVATNPALHLVMAGPDATGWRLTLREQAERLGIADRVLFPGMLVGDEKWGALRAAEVFALPSHQENFGLAVVEALACGTPALLSQAVNIWREIVDDGAALAAADDGPGTLATLRDWLALPEPDRAAMRVRARECFLRRFEAAAAARHLAVELTAALTT